MVDKLGSLSHVMLRLQQQRMASPGVPGATAQAAMPAGGRPQARPSVRDRVMQRLMAVDADDPKRRQRTLRAFVEVQLLDTFGEGLNNDAGFQQLVDEVSQAMLADAALRTDIETAVDTLLAPR